MEHSTGHIDDNPAKDRHRNRVLPVSGVDNTKILAKIYSEILSWPAEHNSKADPVANLAGSATGSASGVPDSDKPVHDECITDSSMCDTRDSIPVVLQMMESEKSCHNLHLNVNANENLNLHQQGARAAS